MRVDQNAELSLGSFNSRCLLSNFTTNQSEAELQMELLQAIDHLCILSSMGFGIDDYVIGASASARLYLDSDKKNSDLDVLIDLTVSYDAHIAGKFKTVGAVVGNGGAFLMDQSEHLDFGPITTCGGPILNFKSFYPMSFVLGGYRFMTIFGVIQCYHKLYQYRPCEKWQKKIRQLTGVLYSTTQLLPVMTEA